MWYFIIDAAYFLNPSIKGCYNSQRRYSMISRNESIHDAQLLFKPAYITIKLSHKLIQLSENAWTELSVHWLSVVLFSWQPVDVDDTWNLTSKRKSFNIFTCRILKSLKYKVTIRSNVVSTVYSLLICQNKSLNTHRSTQVFLHEATNVTSCWHAHCLAFDTPRMSS